MRISSISRCDFMRGLATGVLSVAIVPPWAGKLDMTPKSTKPTERSEQTVTSLLKFFDCNKYFSPGLAKNAPIQSPGFPKCSDLPRTPDLLAHLDRLSIDCAVAWHTAACDLHPMAENELLIQEIETVCAHNRIDGYRL